MTQNILTHTHICFDPKIFLTQNYFWPKNLFGLKNFFRPKIFLDQKFPFLVNLSLDQASGLKRLDQKNFDSKVFDAKLFWIDISGGAKILIWLLNSPNQPFNSNPRIWQGGKILGVRKSFWSEKILGPKKFLVRKNSGPKKFRV